MSRYPLLTSGASFPALIEVYPHPALIELAKADRRLPYKHAKSLKYWPGDSLIDRRHKLLSVWADIVSLLDCRIEGVASALPLPDPSSRGHELKAYEDCLDAVVCAWVGTCVLDGTATAYGDEASAIWVPTAATWPNPFYLGATVGASHMSSTKAYQDGQRMESEVIEWLTNRSREKFACLKMKKLGMTPPQIIEDISSQTVI